MDSRDEETHGRATATHLEGVLDQAIAALTRMDAEMLVQLTCCCRNWDTDTHASIPEPERSKLSWKLLIFERLLRQTRINLNVIGLGKRDDRSAARYQVLDGY